MSEIKSIKINTILESQIPEFLNQEYPLFREFLTQYYISQEYQTGVVDLARNLNVYKSIDNFNGEVFYTSNNPCTLTANVLSFDDVINVNHTIGFPDTYGLIKIGNEIITYTNKTETSFIGCFRGFSGIDRIGEGDYDNSLIFSTTSVEEHSTSDVVTNLSLIFFEKLFEKFKIQFLPGFENRKFYSELDLQTILSRAKDFYITKGTDTSFELLFKILFGKEIKVVKPKEFMLRPSDNKYFVTKNILVEKISGGDPLNLNGSSIFQNRSDNLLASASIYNVEYRPLEGKNYYEISLDSTSFLLNFETTKKTNIMEVVPAGSNSIIVDSTIGFNSSGTLQVFTSSYDEPIEITYTDKTINQFLNVTGNNVVLEYNSKILEKNYLYSYLDDESIVEFRLINVIDNIDYSETSKLRIGDKISLSAFGYDLNNKINFNSWIYNLPTSHQIQSISKTGLRSTITLKDTVRFIVGEYINLSNEYEEFVGPIQVIDIDSNNPIVEAPVDISEFTKLTKIITKGTGNSNILDIPCGVQNTYSDYNSENLYVASTGIPNYEITDDLDVISFSGYTSNSEVGIAYTLKTSTNHNYLTGERVYYISTTSSGIHSGPYYVRKISDNQISFAYNQSDLYSNQYVNVFGFNSGDKIIKLNYWDKENNTIKVLENQKLFKKFNINNKETLFNYDVDRSTSDRPIGILINGVELYSPTVFNESVYYGSITDILVEAPGTNYDVINRPTLDITDALGVGAKCTANVSGSVKEIKIISPGIGYQSKPKVTITGGNGEGAVLETNLIRSKIVSSFNGNSSGVGVSPANTITFISNHNFESGEEVIYKSNGNTELRYINSKTPGNYLPLSNNSSYFVGKVSNTQIKLYNTRQDAINLSSNNIINIAPVGISSGIHEFETLNSKNTITNVYVKEPGRGYSNKSITISSENGVNTYDNYILAHNHHFNEKDTVVYSYSGSAVGGLSTTTQYLVSILDKDKFRLCDAGLGISFSDANYVNKNYINLTSIGSGSHTISYPEIKINVEVTPGISQTSITQPVLQAIVLGSIDSVFLEDSGYRYGTSDIINFHRRPYVGISSISSEAILKPVIVNGSIISAQILNSGNGYGNDVDIIIDGSGKYADILPIISNGRLTSVNVLNLGIGYSNETQLTLRRRGTGLTLKANVYEWKINQVKKLNANSAIIPNKNYNQGLKYINFYPSEELRISVKDNYVYNLNEWQERESNNTQSPILGWAYDGNPIYGPYILNDSAYKKAISSYKLQVELNSFKRPQYPEGFFIQDYQYTLDSDSDLDEYNGRYCKTIEFPNGVYAYVYTPEFPFVVGPAFKNNPIKENFDLNFNQDTNIEDLGIIRNVGHYYINSVGAGYELLNKVNKNYKQEFTVSKTLPSGINFITIYNPGENYNVNDIIVFNNKDSEGTGVSAAVSRVNGKEISNIQVGVSTYESTIFYNKSNQIFGATNTPHNFITGDEVTITSISNSNYSGLEGSKKVFVNQKVVGLVQNVLSQSNTGVSTFIVVNDISGFDVDDFIKIDNEILKVTNISAQNSTLNVNRYDNYTGIHTAGTSTVQLLPTKFSFIQENIVNNSSNNQIVYFNPSDSLGIGTIGYNYSIVGIGSTFTTNRFVPSKTIYIPNHKFYTGQELKYNSGLSGNGILVSNTGAAYTFRLQDNQKVYAVNLGVDYVGLSTLGFTTTTGIGTNLNSLYFQLDTNIGYAHSLKTNYNLVTGRVENYYTNVSTAQTHGLLSGNTIKFNIFPSLNETITFRYDNILRKITTQKNYFDASSGINTVTSEITINTESIKTGDKIAYYAEGNAVIVGLNDNAVYYVLKQNPNTIKLCNTRVDALIGNYISLTNYGVGTHAIAKINPNINVTKGNTITIDTSDVTLDNMKLVLYKDSEFTKELETYNYELNILNTQNIEYPSELYYTFVANSSGSISQKQISSDTEVLNNNKIVIKRSIYNKEYSVISTGSTSFKVNLAAKPENLISGYTASNIFYDTNSPTAYGPISKIKINSNGKGYKKLPKIVNILSNYGYNAILKSNSNKIGIVDSLERIKDGFDYPTDSTLKPYLSVPAIVQIENISRVDYVGITTGGKNYNVAPTLRVLNADNTINNDIVLGASIQGGSVIDVQIIQNTNNLSTPLNIISTNNSNGIDINDISVVSSSVILELINVENETFPLSPIGFGQTSTIFPFEIGDEVFIERCRISSSYDLSNNLITKANYNSSNNQYKFFKVKDVNAINFTVTLDLNDFDDPNLGSYDISFGYGYVVNKKNIPQFVMNIIDDLSYTSNESVAGYSGGNQVFSATVMENGWDNDINELRLIDCKGELEVGNLLKGSISLLNGTVKTVNKFNLIANLGISRDKVNDFGDKVGFTNDYLQRLSDNDYYQKFSYAINSEISYDKWKEPVKSLVHPSGYKEFSDLNVIGIPTSGPVNAGIAKSTNMKVTTSSDLALLVNIDSESSFYTKYNFVSGIDENVYEDGSTERVTIEGAELKPYILCKTNKVISIDDISSQFTGITSAATGQIVGLSSFKLKNSIGIGTNSKSYSLFYREFDSSNGISSVVNINSNSFNINNHNFQSGQKIIYSYGSGTPIGIATTSAVESSIVVQKFNGNIPYLSVASTESSVLMQVNGGGAIGSALYENGYNVAISTSISGISSTIIANASKSVFYGFGNPFPQKSTTGIGTDAKFSVFITYNGSGSPISTSIVLNSGGRGYGVGNVVSISGTFIGGATPTNDLSFSVSKISNSQIVGQANQIYTNVSGISVIGIGTGALFNISRDTVGAISNITVGSGGVGYALTDNIRVLGSSVGGTSPTDDIFLSPTLLGTNKLPSVLYVKKTDDNNISVTGLSTTIDSSLDLVSLGIGTHSFAIDNPNANSLITIDNIIQSPVFNRNFYVGLAATIGITTTKIYLNSGISSISGLDLLQIDKEYLKITSVGIGSTNVIDVERGFLGSIPTSHSINSSISVMRGDYNIINDVIYFTTAPYGKNEYGQASSSGVTTTLYAKSSFQGRVFSRKYDFIQDPNDTNFILDDISLGFTGLENTIGIRTGTLNSNNILAITGINTAQIALGDVLNLQYTNNLFLNSNSYVTSIGVGSIGILPSHNISVGVATTTIKITRSSHILNSNNNVVVGLYTNTNSILSSVSNVNNNPIILINNIPQVSNKDFIIDSVGNNAIKFISGIPNAGKILNVAITTGYGYQPLVGASASVSVSSAGTISNVYLTGAGAGYRTSPQISLTTNVGSGAVLSASVGIGGTITSLTIVSPGTGYTTSSIPVVNIDLPQGYSNLGLAYTGGTSGVGTNAKVSVVVGNGSSIVEFKLDSSGNGYKTGEILKVIGLSTNPNVGVGFSEFRITIKDVFTDKFSGFYPGQFIQFNDVSKYFNGSKRTFTLSITENNITEVLSFKTLFGSDLDINNNIFVYINDILQVPGKSYSFKNSRIIFTEAPKSGSKCNILFYRGSDKDVQQVDPIRSIKEGDIIRINRDLYDLTVRPQFERVVKKIISVDQLDTFTYDSFGINTLLKRPTDWTKQTEDAIINGVLYSKSRPDLKAKVTPTARIIKNVAVSDVEIYVDNAFPLFTAVDENNGVNEELRDIIVVDNNEVSIGFGTATVSLGSTISSVQISYGGTGYQGLSSPKIIIPSSKIYNKDAAVNWKFTTGIATNNDFNSVTYGNVLVAVGSSGLIGISSLGSVWTSINTGYGTTISYSAVFAASNNRYISVGSSGIIISSSGIGTTISNWTQCPLVVETQDIANQITIGSTIYNNTFNDVIYSSSSNSWVAVGNSGAIFVSPGIGSTSFIQKTLSSVKNDLKSVANNEGTFVAVGSSGQLVYSLNMGITWTSGVISYNDLEKIIWDGTKFIAIGKNSTIIYSTNGFIWYAISPNINFNFKNIVYYNGIYYIITDLGTLYYSFDLSYWTSKSTNQSNIISDILFAPISSSEGRTIIVGYGGTTLYADPILNQALVVGVVSNNTVTSANILSGGFGYAVNTSIPVLIEGDSPKLEKIYSIKSKGDYGTITKISVASSTIDFTLKSEVYNNTLLGVGYSSLNVYGITYSGLSLGDYFTIVNSNVVPGYALTGITTSLGGMSNYPASKIGTAVSFIDGVYRVEKAAADVASGIVTVTCAFVPPLPSISIGINTYYGNYSWSKIYGYENRIIGNSKAFTLNTDSGLVGLSSAPVVYRTRGVV
jgi:hypothetical protein